MGGEDSVENEWLRISVFIIELHDIGVSVERNTTSIPRLGRLYIKAVNLFPSVSIRKRKSFFF